MSRFTVVLLIVAGIVLFVLLNAATTALAGLSEGFEAPKNPDVQIVSNP